LLAKKLKSEHTPNGFVLMCESVLAEGPDFDDEIERHRLRCELLDRILNGAALTGGTFLPREFCQEAADILQELSPRLLRIPRD
jgi:hypothetical protein